MSWLVSLITALLGLFLKHKQDQVEEVGEDKQKVVDTGAAYDTAQAAARSSAAADQRGMLDAPSADTVATPDSLKGDPDLPTR